MTTAATLRRQRETHIRLATAARMEPADHQEAHSPTAPVLGRDGKPLGRRRQVDQRVWDSFSIGQEAAALKLRDGYEQLALDTRVAISQYDRVTGKGLPCDDRVFRLIQLERDYRTWRKNCDAAGIDAGSAIDVLYHNVPMNEIDRTHRRRKGWSRVNLMEALNVFAKAKGWAEGNTDDVAEAA